MKKFIEKLFKKSQQEPSEKLPHSDNLPSVSEKVCQEPENYQEPVVIPSSPQVENTKTIKEVESEVSLLPVLRAEFNFLKYPFFDLSHKTSKRNQIEVREIVTTEEGKLNTLWKVTRGLEQNFPSSFARKVHIEVVERTINELRKPIPQLVRLGCMSDICRKLSINNSGKNFKAIKQALIDIKVATIETKRTFKTKENNKTKKFFEGYFNLYEMVFFAGERLPDGEIADAVYVLLSAMFIQNYNNGFTVPLDIKYLQNLRGDITHRMYECLSLWFFPALENGKDSIQKPYSTLCNYFPLTRHSTKAEARKQLRTSHDQHIASGFLASEPEWIPISEKKDDWLIKYSIGPKALEWYRSIKTDRQSLEIESEPSPKSHRKISTVPAIEEKKSVEDNQKIDNFLVIQLVNLGVAKTTAEALVNIADPEVIQDQIAALPLRRNIEDKPAFLIKAIQENYPIPEEIRKKKEVEQQQQEEKLKDEYEKYIISKVDEHLKTMNPEQIEKEIDAHIEPFFQKYPHYEEFRGGKGIKQYIRFDYKMEKAIELNLPAFEEWKKKVTV